MIKTETIESAASESEILWIISPDSLTKSWYGTIFSIFRSSRATDRNYTTISMTGKLNLTFKMCIFKGSGATLNKCRPMLLRCYSIVYKALVVTHVKRNTRCLRCRATCYASFDCTTVACYLRSHCGATLCRCRFVLCK